MPKKSMNVLQGIKATNIMAVRKVNDWRHHITPTSQANIDRCLNCTKPARECKGNCVFKK